jgi:predicted nuclease of predicted toxin-antitoxin system
LYKGWATFRSDKKIGLMKFLANENFPRLSVEFLRSAGYNVIYVAEGFKSISDAAIMEIAIKEERTIITF